MSQYEAVEHLHQIYLRDSGTGEPEDSADFDRARNRIISLLQEGIKNGRQHVEEQFDDLYRSAETPEEKDKVLKAKQKWKDICLTEREDCSFEQTQKYFRYEVKSIFRNIGKNDSSYQKITRNRERHYHLRTPFSWFGEITKEYRGIEKSYLEAIMLLSYVIFNYRMYKYKNNPLLRIKPKEISKVIGTTENAAQEAIRYLRKKGLVKVIIIKGLVPWYDREDATSGSYRFIIPMPGKIRDITYVTIERAINAEGFKFTGEKGSVAQWFLQEEMGAEADANGSSEQEGTQSTQEGGDEQEGTK